MNALRPLPGLVVALATFVLDQLVKWWVAGPLALQERVMVDVLPIFRLTWAENRGVSLGFLTADSESERWGLVAMTALIAIGVIVWMWREKALADIMALGLVLGGALGNIVDRVRFGFVVDFLDLHFGDFRPFMIFNIADAAISIGVLIILARSLFSGEKPKAETAPAAPES